MLNKTLHLVLKGIWYDKIASGKKTSEYRECKPYWNRRIIKFWDETHAIDSVVIFHRGYSDVTMTFEIKNIYKTFGANDLNVSPVWEIQLGKRVK